MIIFDSVKRGPDYFFRTVIIVLFSEWSPAPTSSILFSPVLIRCYCISQRAHVIKFQEHPSGQCSNLKPRIPCSDIYALSDMSMTIVVSPTKIRTFIRHDVRTISCRRVTCPVRLITYESP